VNGFVHFLLVQKVNRKRTPSGSLQTLRKDVMFRVCITPSPSIELCSCLRRSRFGFWDILFRWEAIFRRLRGVIETEPGYVEGAEVIQIKFDPQIISYEKLLEVFFALHDPTSLNKQGADGGTQYRSAVFYYDENQKREAETAKAK